MMSESGDASEENDKRSRIKNALWYLVLIIGLSLVILYWGVFIDINDLILNLEPVVPKVAVALLTLFLVNLFIKMSRPILRAAYITQGGKPGDWKVVSNIYVYVIWVLTGLIIFTGIFGSVSSLGISLGIIGAGLAFALQQPILSFSGFFLIMVKRPFIIGDRLVLTKEGVMGDVEDITLFFFVLKEVTNEESLTGKSVIVPNSVVFQGSMINYSYDTPHVWQTIPVSVTYESDIKLAEKLLYAVAKKVAGEEMKRGARMIRTKVPDSVQADQVRNKPVIRIEFADSSVNLNIRIMCLPKQLRSYRTEIYKEVFRLFNHKENKGRVEIAYPHMELVAHPSITEAIRA